jgi:RecA-family ATPase
MGLGVWEAADDIEPPPPRGWLLGRTFCREYLSSLLGPGAGGKTALRYAQLLSCASGRSLTGEHVYERCRVLIVPLEDDAAELRRRILAALLHHKVERKELRGFLFLSARGGKAGKIMTAYRGSTVRGTLADELEREIIEKKIDIVAERRCSLADGRKVHPLRRPRPPLS